MERIEEILDGVKTMGIGGHVRPDGDCVRFLHGTLSVYKEMVS